MDRGEHEPQPEAASHGLCALALAEVWRESRRWLAAIVYAYKPRQVDLDDLMQDVAMKLIEHGQHLIKPGDPAAVRPWLRTVAINTARSAGRKVRTRGRAFDDLERQFAARTNGSDDEDGDDARVRGRRALEIAVSLPPAYREPLLLSLRGLSHREIANVMDVPATTIETRLIRARRMVREELDGLPISAPQESELNEVLL